MTRQQKTQIKKWASLTLLIIGSLIPGIIFSYLGGISLFTVAVLQISLMGFCSVLYQVLAQQLFDSEHYRNIDPKKPKELELVQLVADMAKLAKMDAPRIQIAAKQDKKPQLNMQCISWLFRSKLIISEELLDIYDKSISLDLFKAMIAHELNHLKQQHHWHRFLGYLFENSAILLTGISMLTLPFLIGIAAIIPIIGLGILTVINHITFRTFLRANEILADIAAAELTQKYEAIGDDFEQLHFHYLHWAIIVEENQFSEQNRYIASDELTLNYLKSNYQQCRDSVPKQKQFMTECRHHIKNKQGHTPSDHFNSPRSMFVSWLDWSMTWANEYPTWKERKQALHEEYSGKPQPRF